MCCTGCLLSHYFFFTQFTMHPYTQEEDLKGKELATAAATELRSKLKVIEEELREFSDCLKSDKISALFDKSECIANSILAIRHCEDSRMRLGKVIQYAGTGISSFDKPKEA